MKTLLLISAVLLCGCATHKILDPTPNDFSTYRYYVIDSNSDVPDANFSTFEEYKEKRMDLILKFLK